MYGYYKPPLNPLRISKGGINLSIEKENNYLQYKRTCCDSSVEKLLLTEDCGIIINPVEPLKTPKDVTPYLLIDFEKAVFVEPKGVSKIYITFPVDIGIFISGHKNYDLLDVFTLAMQKFTLYGDPGSGIICKYHKSPIYTSLPEEINILSEGIMRLIIINTTDRWEEITKFVFDSHGMKIYFDEKLVSLKANMKLITDNIAETDFVDSGIQKGMKKSLEVYTVAKLPVTLKRFTMEEGF